MSLDPSLAQKVEECSKTGIAFKYYKVRFLLFITYLGKMNEIFTDHIWNQIKFGLTSKS